jgi:hypothetical protein
MSELLTRKELCNQLIENLATKIEIYENMPVEIILSPVHGSDLIGLMKDLLAIFQVLNDMRSQKTETGLFTPKLGVEIDDS